MTDKNPKDEHPVEEQLQEMKAAFGIAGQLNELVSYYMQGEMKAGRNPGANDIFQRVAQHAVELEHALSDMVVGLTRAQALEEVDEEVKKVAERIIQKLPAPPKPDLPF